MKGMETVMSGKALMGFLQAWIHCTTTLRPVFKTNNVIINIEGVLHKAWQAVVMDVVLRVTFFLAIRIPARCKQISGHHSG